MNLSQESMQRGDVIPALQLASREHQTFNYPMFTEFDALWPFDEIMADLAYDRHLAELEALGQYEYDYPAGTPDEWIPDNPNSDGFRMSDFI